MLNYFRELERSCILSGSCIPSEPGEIQALFSGRKGALTLPGSASTLPFFVIIRRLYHNIYNESDHFNITYPWSQWCQFCQVVTCLKDALAHIYDSILRKFNISTLGLENMLSKVKLEG